MDNLFQTSLFAGVTVSLVAYLIGMLLKKKFKLAILNPLLISIVLTIIVLVVADVDYDTYNKGASYLSWFLTPATAILLSGPAPMPLTMWEASPIPPSDWRRFAPPLPAACRI